MNELSKISFLFEEDKVIKKVIGLLVLEWIIIIGQKFCWI